MAGRASEIFRVRAIVENGKECGTRSAHENCLSLMTLEQPLLEFGEEAVLAENRAFKIIDDRNSAYDLGGVGNSGDFKGMLESAVGIGGWHAESGLEEEDLERRRRGDCLDDFAAAGAA